MADLPRVYAGFNNMAIPGTPVTVESIQQRINTNDRWGTNLISGGARFELPVDPAVSTTDVITRNEDTTGGKTLGFSTDVVQGNQVIGGQFPLAITEGLAFVMQYDAMRFYKADGTEVAPPIGTHNATLGMTASFMTASRHIVASAESGVTQGVRYVHTAFIPYKAFDEMVTYTDTYGSGAQGWFFDLKINFYGSYLTDVTKVVIENFLITVIPESLYDWIKADETARLPYEPTLEEMLDEIQNGGSAEQTLYVSPNFLYKGKTPIALSNMASPDGDITFDIKGIVKNLFQNVKDKTGFITKDYNLRTDIILSGAGYNDTELTALNAVRPVGVSPDMAFFDKTFLKSGNPKKAVKYPGYPLELAYLNVTDETITVNLIHDDGTPEAMPTDAIHFTIDVPDDVVAIAIGEGGSIDGPFVFTESQEWTVPDGVTELEVFAVGGGGSGARGRTLTDFRNIYRNGGNGGQVVLQTVSVIPGNTYSVNIGQGGIPTAIYIGTNGGDTSFADIITAAGGIGGYTEGSAIYNFAQPVVEGSATGGWRITGSGSAPNEPRGENGMLCPLDLSTFPELDGKRFGAAGSTGAHEAHDYSAETGGGMGGYYGFTGIKDGTFYGAGGGGGAYMSDDPGSGYQGILIINVPPPPPPEEAMTIETRCVKAAPFYVRWINRIGGYDYYMFDRGNRLTVETDNALMIERYALSPDNTDTRDVYALDAAAAIDVTEENLDRETWDTLAGLAVSPRIEWYDETLEVWKTISIESSDNSFERASATGAIRYTFLLEQVLTQF
jgi:hypothetical protein